MKPYGLPRTDGQDDVAGIKEFGSNTSTGGKCYQRSKQKARVRKIYKTRERRKQSEEIQLETLDKQGGEYTLTDPNNPAK